MRRAALIAAGTLLLLLLLLQLPVLLPRLGDRMISNAPPTGEQPRKCPPDMLLLKDASHRFCIDKFEAPNLQDKRPTRALTLDRAQAYCAHRGRRLCSEGEWCRACVGPDGAAAYPADCINPSSEPRSCGQRPECDSPEGVADLSGNMLEWTSDGLNQPRAFFLKGGSYMTPDGYTSCGYQVVILPDQKSFSRPDLGVRCCL